MFWLDDPYGSSRYSRLSGFSDPWGVDRRGFAPVSQRARDARFQADKLFLDFLATADTSNGPATQEIIDFHMVPDMRKSFSKHVKEYKCTATPRQLTRAEQDKINPGRKSLMWYTSVTVTPEAQKAYLEKNPAIAEKTKAKREQIKAEEQEKRNKSPDGEVGQPAQPEASASSSKKRTAADAELPARAVSEAKKATA